MNGFKDGFIQRCLSVGVDPVQLVKYAATNTTTVASSPVVSPPPEPTGEVPEGYFRYFDKKTNQWVTTTPADYSRQKANEANAAANKASLEAEKNRGKMVVNNNTAVHVSQPHQEAPYADESTRNFYSSGRGYYNAGAYGDGWYTGTTFRGTRRNPAYWNGRAVRTRRIR